MKQLKILGMLALVLVLVVSFSVSAVAQDKKQDNTQKTETKADVKKVEKANCGDKAKAEECCRHSAKMEGKVLINKVKGITGAKEHDCGKCSGEMKAKHEAACEKAKAKKEDKKEKK